MENMEHLNSENQTGKYIEKLRLYYSDMLVFKSSANSKFFSIEHTFVYERLACDEVF